MSKHRRSVPSVRAAVLAAVTMAACHALEPDAASAGGLWESVTTEAGTSERWLLDVKDGVVHGTGTWTGAACCGPGTLTLTGSARGDSLHLHLTYFVTFAGDSLYVFRDGDRIDVVLDSRTDVVGTRLMTFGSGPVPGQHPTTIDVLRSDVHFRRISP